jgi:acyl-CoA synthetase (AMP-forming)/AMP-acid ligase II
MLLHDGVARTLLLAPPGLPAEALAEFRKACGIGDANIGDSNTQWAIATSGTTGTPKLTLHSLASLTRTTRHGAPRDSPHRWALLYDVQRFAGLQVLLQALAGGDTLLIPRHDAPVEDVVAFLAGNGCDAISATPTLWRRILMSPGARSLQPAHVTLGGEIADQAVLDALAAAFPRAAIRHIYASTEAGVGFTVNDRLEGFPAEFLTRPPSGVSIGVSDAGHLILGGGAARVDTGDLVALDGGRYRFMGRASGSINVGGNKLQPEEVERVLREHPDVVEAVVYAKKSAITGSVVCADVVARAGVDPGELKRGVIAHCRGRLEAFKVPAVLRVVESIGAASTGKIERKAS